ncbi:RHS repeat-associated core domain-containing protein [Flavobacteriaceae bacterium 3-367]
MTTEYAGNYIYEGSALQFFNHAEGYIEPDGSGGYDYIYQYKDHLGNIRLAYHNSGTPSSPTLQIREENNYYPFGLKHKGYNGGLIGRNHKFGFGGKEEQEELGLDWVDITARNYDPALGRWMNSDPLAEQMRRHSPYNYAFDNPVYFLDADGMMPTSTGDPVKKIVSSQTSGNVNPTRTVTFAGRGNSNYDVGTLTPKYGFRGGDFHTHTLPTSGRSTVGVSVEFSTTGDGDFSAVTALTGSTAPEFVYSVSSKVTTTTSQFFDSDGNKVDSIDNASSFSVVRSTETTTVNVGIGGEVPSTASVSNSNETTTYDVTGKSGFSDFGGKQLSNPTTNSSAPTISTINFSDASSTLQNLAKQNVKDNFAKAAKFIIDRTKNISKKVEQYNWEPLKSL